MNSALIAVLAQRLVRKICSGCKTENPQSTEMIQKYKLADIAQNIGCELRPVMYGKGCEKCGHTGYSGRMAIIEYLRNDLTIQEMQKNEAFVGNARKYMHKVGRRNLFEDGLYKVLQGETTIEEVLRVTG